jgi:hypothetical protein
MLNDISLPQEISIDELNLIGKYIQSETVIPMNIYEVTTKVFDFVLDDPSVGSANHPLVDLDTSDGTAFDSEHKSIIFMPLKKDDLLGAQFREKHLVV